MYSPAKCDDCGLPYEEFPLDVVFPSDEWELISGNGEGGGLLCARCIANRAGKLDGVIAIKAMLERTPVPITQEALASAGWEKRTPCHPRLRGVVEYWKTYRPHRRDGEGAKMSVGVRFGKLYSTKRPFTVWLSTGYMGIELSITTMTQLNTLMELLTYKEED